jgi:hypothetical protein
VPANSGWANKVYARYVPPAVLQQEVRADAFSKGIIDPRPLSIGDLLSGTFRAVRFAPGVMMGLTLVIALLSQLLALAFAFGTGNASFDLNDLLFGGTDAAWSSYMSSLGMSSLCTTLASVVASVYLTHAVFQGVLGREVKPPEALHVLRLRVWPVIVLTLLQYAVMMVAFGLWIAMIAVGVAGASAMIGLAILAVFGGIFVGGWLWVRLTFAVPAIVVEGLGPIQGLRRGWLLSRGIFGHVLGYRLLASILIGIAVGTVTQGFSVALGLFAGVIPAAMIAVTPIASVVSITLSAPLHEAVSTLLYVDARIRREGYDIELLETMTG